MPCPPSFQYLLTLYVLWMFLSIEFRYLLWRRQHVLCVQCGYSQCIRGASYHPFVSPQLPAFCPASNANPMSSLDSMALGRVVMIRLNPCHVWTWRVVGLCGGYLTASPTISSTCLLMAPHCSPSLPYPGPVHILKQSSCLSAKMAA